MHRLYNPLHRLPVPIWRDGESAARSGREATDAAMMPVHVLDNAVACHGGRKLSSSAFRHDVWRTR